MITDEWKERVTSFLLEYIKPHSVDAYDRNGNFTIGTMKDAVKILLDNKVFVSKSDMKQEALSAHSVILPDALFGE